MNARSLVDTDWAIEYLKGRAEVVERLDTARQEGLGISIISLADSRRNANVAPTSVPG